jgi:LCP family protein required for cell wall assembly
MVVTGAADAAGFTTPPDEPPLAATPHPAIPPDEPAHHAHKRPLWLRTLAVVGILSVVCSAVAVAGAFALNTRYEGKVERADILGDVPRPKPSAPSEGGATGPLNFLVLGSDSRSPDPQTIKDPNGERSDTIMVVHVSRDLKSAFIVSIPRDSYVNVPAGGNWKGGKNKINAAFAFGGAKLTAKTVYELTKVPLDGAMIVNFGGIHSMVDVVGTVNVCIPYAAHSTFSTKVWAKGCHDMGPDEAEEFMRQRKGVPGGDFGRIHDQQLVVKALAHKISDEGMLTHPLTLDRLIVTAAASVTVDSSTDLRGLILKLKGIAPDNIRFATAPYVRTMQTDAGSSVELDMKGTQELFRAVIDDRANEWLAAHPQKVPGT